MEHRAQRVQQDILQEEVVVAVIRHKETQVEQVVAELEQIQEFQEQLILVVVAEEDHHKEVML
jgi:hypothetical protein